LASIISENPAFTIDSKSIHTNIVLFDVKEGSATKVLDHFSGQGVHMIPFGPKTIRATFHFQVDDEDLAKVIAVVQNY